MKYNTDVLDIGIVFCEVEKEFYNVILLLLFLTNFCQRIFLGCCKIRLPKFETSIIFTPREALYCRLSTV